MSKKLFANVFAISAIKPFRPLRATTSLIMALTDEQLAERARKVAAIKLRMAQKKAAKAKSTATAIAAAETKPPFKKEEAEEAEVVVVERKDAEPPGQEPTRAVELQSEPTLPAAEEMLAATDTEADGFIVVGSAGGDAAAADGERVAPERRGGRHNNST
jgi:hypothetical protein